MISRVGVGIIGFGTVGTGVAKILLENAALISRRVGVPIEIIRIADLDVTRDRGLALPPGLLTTDAKQILTDPVDRYRRGVDRRLRCCQTHHSGIHCGRQTCRHRQ